MLAGSPAPLVLVSYYSSDDMEEAVVTAGGPSPVYVGDA